MKYIVSYECRTDGKIFNGTVEMESESLPLYYDDAVLELVEKDSVQFYKSGTAGIQVKDIVSQNWGMKLFNLFKSKRKIEQEKRANFFYKNCKDEIQKYIDDRTEPDRDDILKIAVNAKIMYSFFSNVKHIQAEAREFVYPLTTNGLAVFAVIDEMELYAALEKMQNLVKENYNQLVEKNTSDLSLPSIDAAFAMSKLVNFDETLDI